MPGTNLGARNAVVNKMDKILVLVEFILWREKKIDNVSTFYRMLVIQTLKKSKRRKKDRKVGWIGRECVQFYFLIIFY